MNVTLRAAALLSLSSWMMGCATAPSINWDSRVGTYTLDQAKAGLGQPTQVLQFNDGTLLAEWITGETPGNPPMAAASPGGYGSRRHWVDRQGMEALSQSYSEYLHLTFSAEERLLKWDQGRK